MKGKYFVPYRDYIKKVLYYNSIGGLNYTVDNIIDGIETIYKFKPNSIRERKRLKRYIGKVENTWIENSLFMKEDENG